MVLMPLCVLLFSWQVCSRGRDDGNGWEEETEMKGKNILLTDLRLRSVYIAQIYFVTVGPHLSSIYICLEQENVSYSLGHVMHKSKLQDLSQSSCRLDPVFQVLHMYVIWSNAPIPLKRNECPPYDAVIVACDLLTGKE